MSTTAPLLLIFDLPLVLERDCQKLGQPRSRIAGCGQSSDILFEPSITDCCQLLAKIAQLIFCYRTEKPAEFTAWRGIGCGQFDGADLDYLHAVVVTDVFPAGFFQVHDDVPHAVFFFRPVGTDQLCEALKTWTAHAALSSRSRGTIESSP